MAVQADYISAVQQLYVSYFGRPADYYGLDNFTKQLAAIDTAGTLVDFKALAAAANATSATSPLGKLINSFSGSAEAAALYGTDTSIAGTSKFVAAVYQNILGREADVEGLTYWVNAIQSGGVTRANAAAAITEGALSNTTAQGLLDAKTVANKNAVAVNFTTAINTTNEIIGYAGDKAAAAAREMLAGVDETTNVTAYQATVESTLAIIATGANAGETKILAKGLDNLAGTAGDDTFIGAIDDGNVELNTLSSLDIINGGGGNDTLKIAHGGTDDVVSVGNLTSVEVISVESAAADGLTIDTTTVAGITTLNIIKAAEDVNATAAATTDVTVNMKQAAGVAVTVNGGKNIAANITDSKAASGSLDFGNAGADASGAVNVTTSGAAAVNGSNQTLANILVGGGTTINVTQKATSSTGNLVAGAAVTTHAQGDVTVDASAVTTEVTVKQDAAATGASVAAVTGATEVATVKFTALTTGQTVTVGGLTFEASKNLTAAEVAAAFSKLSSAAATPESIALAAEADGDTQGTSAHTNGFFTGSLVPGWNSGVAVGDTVTFTAAEAGDIDDLTGSITPTIVTAGVDAVAAKNSLTVSAGVVDITGGAAVKSVTVNGYSAAGSNFNGTGTALATLNLANGGAFVVSDTADTLALSLEKVGTAANVALTFTAAPTTLNVKSVGANGVNLTAAATKAMNVTGTGVLNVAATNLAALETVKVSETAGLTLGAGASATLTSVDTTATTGTVTATIDGAKATYTGGAGTDKVSVDTNTALTKAIDLGAGNDTLTFGVAVSGSTAALSGGAGTDTLSMTLANADALDNTKQTFYTNFERLLINNSGASGLDINLENLGFTNYVTAAGNAGTLTLSNLANNGTVVQTAAAVTGITVNVKDATTGTADVLNYVVSGSSTVAAGILTAAKVETIKLTSTDTSTAGGVAHNLTLAADTATAVTIDGNGGLVLTLGGATTSLATINASANTGGVEVAANGAVVMTITGGSGDDHLTASQGATAKADVIVGGAGDDILVAGDNGAKLTGGDGNDIFVLTADGATGGNKEANTYSIVEDFKAGDLLQLQYYDTVGTAAAEVTSFAKLTASLNPETAVFANFVDAAIAQATLGQAVWFMFGGSSYVVVDSGVNNAGSTFANTEDLIIKLTGVNLTDASWNSDFATVSL